MFFSIRAHTESVRMSRGSSLLTSELHLQALDSFLLSRYCLSVYRILALCYMRSGLLVVLAALLTYTRNNHTETVFI